MKVTVCDDNERVLKELVQILRKLYGDGIEVSTTRMPEQLLEEWEKHPGRTADIILMDIEYPFSNQNGIKISGEIQKQYPRIKIIFITGKINYAQDIFEAKPSNFLVKPFDEQKLKTALDKVIEEIRIEKNENILLKAHSSMVKVRLADILYIESIKHTIVIHTKGKEEVFRMKLKEVLQMLPEDFWFIHQSFIVHGEQVKKIDTEGIELWDGTRLPVARSRYQEIRNKLFNRIENE